MQRLTDDRGAVAVVVALLMVPLIGFAAVALDVAAMWATRQQLQIGADAGAFAVAQDCAKGSCGSPSGTAQGLASQNMNADIATATAALNAASQRVTVTNSAVRQHWFAPVLGIDSSTIRASATAVWGTPTGGTAVLPIAFSWCEFLWQTSGGLPTGSAPTTIHFTKTSSAPCKGPSGNHVPGGFGWLPVDTGSCQTTSVIGKWIESKTGASAPSSCSPADFQAVLNRPVLLPIFDTYVGSGSNATYHVYAYAAFRLTGYNFPGQYSFNTTCPSNDRCIHGYFVRFVDLTEAFSYGSGAPDLGAAVVELTG